VLPLDTETKVAPHSTELEKWVQEGFHGDMSYMETTLRDRLSPNSWMPWGQSLLMFSYQYSLSIPSLKDVVEGVRKTKGKPPVYKVAKYAHYKDYHYTCKSILSGLERVIQEQLGSNRMFRGFVDSAPVFERDWATEIGLGWRGKNSCTIHPEHGSGFLLAGAVLDISLSRTLDMNSFCGSCTRCLDACPTDAFEGPGKLNATKCISYWTIEQKGDIPKGLSEQFGDWVFGCDICQDVCPWNHKHHKKNTRSFYKKEIHKESVLSREDMKKAPDSSFQNPRSHFEKTGLEWLQLLQQGGGFQSAFKETPLLRAGRKKMLRNLTIAIRNQKDVSCTELLEKIKEKEHEKWILEEIEHTLKSLYQFQELNK
jgi:epoxyqueuosine reductase